MQQKTRKKRKQTRHW